MFRSQAREKNRNTNYTTQHVMHNATQKNIYIKTPTYKMMLQLLHTTYKTKYVYMLNKKTNM